MTVTRGLIPCIRERQQFGLVLRRASYVESSQCSADNFHNPFRGKYRRSARLFAGPPSVPCFCTQEKSSQTLKIPLRFFTANRKLDDRSGLRRHREFSRATTPVRALRKQASSSTSTGSLPRPCRRDSHRYTQGPFDCENAAREFGYQGAATPRETYREGLKGLKGFDRLPPDEQDKQLRQIESSHFFSVLRQNTIEGMFCDPMHGGNVDMVGWQLVGFPGPRMSNRAEVAQHFGEAYRPKPVSLEQVIGQKIAPQRR